MQEAALVVVAAASVWLIAIGLFMAVRPGRALRLLSLTASSHRINLTEQGFRLLAGAAVIVRSASSKLPDLFEIGGWFVVISSLLLMLLPLRWHAGYAIWWSRNLPTWAVRVIASLSVAAGVGLLYASF